MANATPSIKARAVSFAVFILIAGIVLAVGGLAITQMGDRIEMRHDEMTERAHHIYDGEVVRKSSDVCYETCVQTIVSKDRLRHDVLMVADNADGWITTGEASNAIPGYSFRNPAILDELVQEGLVEKRVEERFLVDRVEYRYVGPDGKYEGQLSDAELRQRLYKSLYVMEAWATTDELAASVPASHDRVQAMLYTMEADGQIQRDQPGYILKGDTHWGSTELDHSPQQPGMLGLINPIIIVLLAALVLGVIMRFRNSDGDE